MISICIFLFVIAILHISSAFVKSVNHFHSCESIILLSIFTAIVATARIFFCTVPCIKPVLALIILISITFDKEFALLIGCASCFISNFILGQGIWTLYQMVCLGYLGFFYALLFDKFKIQKNKITVSSIGFLFSILFSLLINFFSYSLFSKNISVDSFFAYCLASLFFDLSNAFFTEIFLLISYEKISKVLLRIKSKIKSKL